MSLKIDGIPEFVAEHGLAVGQWYELGIRFMGRSDGRVDIVETMVVRKLTPQEISVMKGTAQKGLLA